MIRKVVLLTGSKPSETLVFRYGALDRQAFRSEPESETGVAAIVQLDTAMWQSSDVNLLELDHWFHLHEDINQDIELWICGEVENAPGVPLQIVTRYQRLLPLENDNLPPWFLEALAAHAKLFELGKPLVRADFDHSHDTWRWVRRLHPGASPALQLAALFHDVERLLSETDKRVEHLAQDYVQFKHKHAEGSAQILTEVLRYTSAPKAIVGKVAELVSHHESPMDDEELMLLNDADALSFFSLNSWGFVRYFDASHVRKKVAYTLARMRPTTRGLLGSLRLPPEIQYCIG